MGSGIDRGKKSCEGAGFARGWGGYDEECVLADPDFSGEVDTTVLVVLLGGRGLGERGLTGCPSAAVWRGRSTGRN